MGLTPPPKNHTSPPEPRKKGGRGLLQTQLMHARLKSSMPKFKKKKRMYRSLEVKLGGVKTEIASEIFLGNTMNVPSK